MISKSKKQRVLIWKYGLVLIATTIAILFYPIKVELLGDAPSTVLEDKHGELLSAQIASDGQWRFPMMDSLPDKFVKCITTYEDKRYFHHFGIDPIAIFRAIRQNIMAGKIVSGGSTLTMQVMRMAYRNQRRTVAQKLKEAFKAIRLEAQYSKSRILKIYATHAPFGGNIVGLETASWKYYNKSPHDLSWAQMATLCVLPNAPSIIRMDRNTDRLLRKRNSLLKRLAKENIIDEIDLELSLSEELNYGHYRLPHLAPHLLARAKKETHKGRLKTTLDASVQQRMNDLLNYHAESLSQKSIHNAGLIIMDTRTQEVIAYVGNVPNTDHEADVDMIKSERSSGSILKPFLYTAMIESGQMTPHSFVKDVPLFIDGFTPKNYNEKFEGILPVSTALSKSLNVPFVLMLQEYGVDKFRRKLRKIGLSSINKSSDHYGLSLILGGAEVRLDELTTTYSHMGRQLFDYDKLRGQYSNDQYPKMWYLENQRIETDSTAKEWPIQSFSASSIHHTFDAMKKVNRPNGFGDWEIFPSSKQIAWKTGTSFGHRDAWAIGIHSQYTIGVWIGNADGEGRDEIIGVSTAGKVLFDAYDKTILKDGWWPSPYDDMTQIEICSKTGMIPSVHCQEKSLNWVSNTSLKAEVCKYHISVWTDLKGEYVVHNSCYDMTRAKRASYFKLSPLVSKYYSQTNGNISNIPELLSSCQNDHTFSDQLEWIYPHPLETIFIPKDLNGERQNIVAQLEHSDPKAEVFWYMNGKYLGSTKEFHTMDIDGEAGDYALLVTDQNGIQIERRFEIVGK